MWSDLGIVALMIPIFGMVVPAVVIIFALERMYRIRKLDHEAKLRAIEKGYDVPMKRPSPRYPFAWPLVLIGFGLALMLIYFLERHVDPEALGFGLVLFFIGAGLFASRFIGVNRNDEEDSVRNAVPLWRAPEPVSAPASSSGSSEPAEPPTTGSAS